MNRAAAFNAVVQGFRTWLAASPYAQVKAGLPDTDFTPPPPPDPWMRLSGQWSGSTAAGAGDREEMHTGMMFLELYWPSGLGYKDVDDAAEAAAAHFRAFSADGGRLRCKGINDGARPSISTPPREPGWTRRTVNVPLRLMEHHA